MDYILAHHGIKGQKWGIRRYQNEDGTLTEAGQKRYVKLLNKNGGIDTHRDFSRYYLHLGTNKPSGDSVLADPIRDQLINEYRNSKVLKDFSEKSDEINIDYEKHSKKVGIIMGLVNNDFLDNGLSLEKACQYAEDAGNDEWHSHTEREDGYQLYYDLYGKDLKAFDSVDLENVVQERESIVKKIVDKNSEYVSNKLITKDSKIEDSVDAVDKVFRVLDGTYKDYYKMPYTEFLSTASRKYLMNSLENRTVRLLGARDESTGGYERSYRNTINRFSNLSDDASGWTLWNAAKKILPNAESVNVKDISESQWKAIIKEANKMV